MKRHGRVLVLVIISALLVAGAAYGFYRTVSRKKAGSWEARRPKRESARPDTILLERTARTEVIEIHGLVVPDRKVKLTAPSGGEVLEAPVQVGRSVKAGDLLTRIDDHLARIDLAEKQAAVRGALAESARALWDLQRKIKLFRDGDLSEENYEAAHLKVQTTMSDLAQRLEAVKRSQRNLRDHEVRAPWEGVVLARHVNRGSRVRVGDPIADLLDVERMQVEAGLSEEQMILLAQGNRAKTLQVSAQARGGEVRSYEPLPVREVRIVKEAEESTRTYPVFFVVSNSRPATLYPGMALRLRIDTGVKRKAFYVPGGAVISRSGKNYVWTVREGRASIREVICGERSGDRIEIRGRLREGDRIVVSNAESLKDGQEIQIAPAAAGRPR